MPDPPQTPPDQPQPAPTPLMARAGGSPTTGSCSPAPPASPWSTVGLIAFVVITLAWVVPLAFMAVEACTELPDMMGAGEAR